MVLVLALAAILLRPSPALKARDRAILRVSLAAVSRRFDALRTGAYEFQSRVKRVTATVVATPVKPDSMSWEGYFKPDASRHKITVILRRRGLPTHWRVTAMALGTVGTRLGGRSKNLTAMSARMLALPGLGGIEDWNWCDLAVAMADGKTIVKLLEPEWGRHTVLSVDQRGRVAVFAFIT